MTTATINAATSEHQDYNAVTYEVHGYTLVARTGHDSKRTDWAVYAPDRDAPTVVNKSHSHRDPAKYGVNWSAFGTKSPAEAREYAEKLADAAEAAEAFTEIRNAE